VLTGVPDGLLVRQDGSLVVVDYKTARFTAAQDALLPMYEVQPNTYGLIAERLRLSPVAKLVLAYCQPMTEDEDADERRRDYGFDIGFVAYARTVNVNPDRLQPLLARTRALHDSASPPPPRLGCGDCVLLDRMCRLIMAERIQSAE